MTFQYYVFLVIVWVAFMLFAPGTRHMAYEKDFLYFNPSKRLRDVLYIIKVPQGCLL